MKECVGVSLVLISLMFLLAWLAAPAVEPPPEREEEPAVAEPEPSGEAEAMPEEEKRGETLRVLVDGQVREMDMFTYLCGVVRAEMPATFETEALKAQAVAARSYTLYKMENGGSANHPQADACDDVTCCKAYLGRAEAAARWGSAAEEYEARICAAVRETEGLCVLYEGRPVLAAFHSSCSGMTRNAEQVWSSSLPYLCAVESPEDATTVPEYISAASFSTARLRELLLAAFPDARLEGRASDWFTNIRRDSSGAVTTLAVGGVAVAGTALRAALGLRSADFTLTFEGDQAVFSTVGYGHGVGMSQYGANVLAEQGKTFREILLWYYTGAQVGPYPAK